MSFPARWIGGSLAILALSFPALALADPAAPPIDYSLSASQIRTNCAAEIARAQSAFTRLVRIPSAKRTFANTVLALEEIGADLNDRLAAETLLTNVSTDRAVRDASLQCQTDVGNYQSALTARPELYRALASVAQRSLAKSRDDRKLLDLWLTAVKRSGAGLAPAQRAEVIALNQKLNDLQNQFGANLGNDTTTIAISRAQVAGLPEDFVATLKASADGGYTVPVNESTSARFLQNAADPTARKAFYFAYNNRQVEKNLPLLAAAIATRDRLAHLLGYRTWAAYVLADRMAATPQRVFKFLDELDAKLLPKARAEIATLAALKGGPIEPWDVSYYDNQLRKTTYAVDSDEVRHYFPVEHTVSAILGIYAKLLGVTFSPVRPANAWHPDVTEYSVTDTATKRFIGVFLLDLYPREGKYSHFANFGILPVRRLAGGTVRPPISAIIGNWPKPAPGHPALLSHEEVETFFHEFGHNMAALLTTSPYETLSSGFRWDFVEAPSQMLENWVWQPSILKAISSNVTTGAPLPDDLIKKIIAARYVNNAYFTTRQIMLATIDLNYHSSGPKVDTTAVWARIAQAETPLALAPGVHPEASFGHLMGGYDAGYYGYLWSRVYAQDLFTAFQRAGLENPAIGARYRTKILQPARAVEPDALVRAFLGRPMSPDAFYREFGITTKNSATR